MTNGAIPADDSFHPVADPDPFWTETAWFAFSVPARGLTGAVYPLFRPNQGVCSCGVYVWDASGEEFHDVRYARTWWHLPMPDHDLTELVLANGVTYTTLEPLRRYHVAFRDADELELDLYYEGLRAPYAPLVGPSGHLDQPCHVTGVVRLHGEEIAVDGYEMRDRSWSVRRDHGAVRAGYDYAIVGPDASFLAMSMGPGDQQVIVAGTRVVDGQVVALKGGTRVVECEDGRPARVSVNAVDVEGGELVAAGTCVNRFAFQSSPNMFAWMSMTRWTFDGVEAWGEDQDVWSPDLLRGARRAGA